MCPLRFAKVYRRRHLPLSVEAIHPLQRHPFEDCLWSGNAFPQCREGAEGGIQRRWSRDFCSTLGNVFCIAMLFSGWLFKMSCYLCYIVIYNNFSQALWTAQVVLWGPIFSQYVGWLVTEHLCVPFRSWTKWVINVGCISIVYVQYMLYIFRIMFYSGRV